MFKISLLDKTTISKALYAQNNFFIFFLFELVPVSHIFIMKYSILMYTTKLIIMKFTITRLDEDTQT